MATRVTSNISDYADTTLRVKNILFTSDSTTLSSSNLDINFSTNIGSELTLTPTSRSILKPRSNSLNTDLVLEPKGAGAVSFNRNGAARGGGAVDLQTNVEQGSVNVASGSYSVIGGGQNNRATGSQSVISGGVLNVAEGSQSSIGGGSGNVSQGLNTHIGGGTGNRVTGNTSVVCGGNANNIESEGSGILGGNNNKLTSTAQNSFIIGSNITASIANFTYVNNLTAEGTIATKIIKFNDGTTISSSSGFSNSTYAPVQQGGGAGQQTDKIYIGWGNTGKLFLTVENQQDYCNLWPIDISGTANTALSATTAAIALSAPGYLQTAGGTVTGNLTVNGTIAASSIRFSDNTVLNTTLRSKTYTKLLGEQRGADSYSCVVNSENKIIVWGECGWLSGGGKQWLPQQIAFEGNYLLNNTSVDVKRLICTKHFIVSLLTDGTVWYCGHKVLTNEYTTNSGYYTYFKQISFSNNLVINDIEAVSVDTDNGTTPTFIVAAITSTKRLCIWGTNRNGCLGTGGNDPVVSRTINTELIHVKQVKLRCTTRGGVNQCMSIILTDTNEVYTAGAGQYGSLGTGGTSDSYRFIRCKINSNTPVIGTKLLSNNQHHIENTYIVAKDISNLNIERIYTCGSNNYYSTGRGTLSQDTLPYFVEIAGLYNPIDLEVVTFPSARSVIAIAHAGVQDNSPSKVYTWGQGTLGIKSVGYTNTPTIIPSLSGIANASSIQCSKNIGLSQAVSVKTDSNVCYTTGTILFGINHETDDTNNSFKLIGNINLTNVEYGVGVNNEIGYCLTKDTYGSTNIQVQGGRRLISSETLTYNTPTQPINLTNSLI